MEPIALIRANEPFTCIYARGKIQTEITKAPGAQFMVLHGDLNPGWQCWLLIYPLDEYIKGSDIFKFKRPLDYTTTLYSHHNMHKFTLETPKSLIIKDNSNTDVVEITNDPTGKIIAKVLIGPESLSKPAPQYATATFANAQNLTWASTYTIRAG